MTFRLRTKFLLSLLTITAALTAATLAVVSFNVKNKMRDSLREELSSSLNTYETFSQQRDQALARSAEFLASLPTLRSLMTIEDIPTIQDGAGNIAANSGSALLVVANRANRVVAAHSLSDGVLPDFQELLQSTQKNADAEDWWYAGGHLYRVRAQPIYLAATPESTFLGTLVVGEEITNRSAQEFSHVAGSDVLICRGAAVVASSSAQLGAACGRQADSGSAHELVLSQEHFLARSLQVSSSSHPAISVSVLKSLDKATEFLSGLNKILLALGLLSVVAGGALIFLISHTFTRPLSDLVSGVRALEQGDFGYPLQAVGGDEVAEVTWAFVRMRTNLETTQHEQKELESRLRQAHKMEAVGRLAGGVAHDFNNLLTIIRGNGDILADRPDVDGAFRRSVEQIQKAAARAVGMTRQLLAFSRMQVLQPRVLDMNAVVSEMGKMLPRLIGEDIEYTFIADPGLFRVVADPGQVEQVILNLAVNARDAMAGGGKLTVKTENRRMDATEAARRPPMAEGEYVLLSVTDTGHGMDEKTKAHIFEPFFTTKEAGKGTGLGLATVYGIVKQSGGFIWVESVPGQGTTFEIYFPASQRVAEALDNPARKALPRGTETILLVEDESGVRELAAQFLRDAGYKVLEACDGVDALEVAGRYAGPVHLVLSDMVMPRMGGKELASRLKLSCPDARLMFMSGYAEYSREEDTAVAGTAALQKPFSRASLLEKVRQHLTGKVPEFIKGS